MNGELRIGFFTRRAISANEELTFDYQFQTVGKKQQKCLCGSKNCRGVLGAPAANNPHSGLNAIWAAPAHSDIEEESALKVATPSAVAVSANSKIKSSDGQDLDVDDSTSDREKTTAEAAAAAKSIESRQKKVISVKTETKTKDDAVVTAATTTVSKDDEMRCQIRNIGTLTSKDSVLKLCQLMYRAEAVENQLDILRLLLNTTSDTSLKLFMDYHGLMLLMNWMIDLDTVASIDEQSLECKCRCLELLNKLGIKNKSTIEEFKLLHLVRKWTEHKTPELSILSFESNNEQSGSEINEISSLLNSMVHRVSTHSERCKRSTELVSELNAKARELCNDWSNLKQSFKIPKRQQIEERREHERQLNSLTASNNLASETAAAASFISSHLSPSMAASEAASAESRRGSYSSSSSRVNLNANRFSQLPSFAGKQTATYGAPPKYRNSVDSMSTPPPPGDVQLQQQQQPVATLTKEQRRQLFEQKVREDEEAARAAAAASAAVAAATSATTVAATSSAASSAAIISQTSTNFCMYLPPPQNQNLLSSQNQQHVTHELKWYFDPYTGQYAQYYVPVAIQPPPPAATINNQQHLRLNFIHV